MLRLPRDVHDLRDRYLRSSLRPQVDGDEGQVLTSGQGPYHLRRKFTLTAGSIAAGDVIELRMVVADGCEVYLDGGSLGGPVQVASVATSARLPPEERQWRFIRVTALGPSSPAGDYVLAAKVYQAGGSTDVSFWADLVVKTPSP